MITHLLRFLSDCTVVYSNPKRPYWRKLVSHRKGEIISVEIVAPQAHLPVCSWRWWRTGKAYWYTLGTNNLFEVQRAGTLEWGPYRG